MTELKEQKENYIWLDLVRGLSALLVLFSHLRTLLFVDYDQTKSGFLANAFYFITGFGHQSVVIFFVLSGYFIVRSIYNSHFYNKWAFSSYFINRIVRLWVVLIPALALTILVDLTGLFLFPDALAYSIGIPTLPEVRPAEYGTWINFIGNIFFLQTIYVPTFGSNSPLWSLSYEFWYYMIFPALFFCISRSLKIEFRIILGCIASLLLYLLGTAIVHGFLVWLLGGVIFYITRRNDTLFNRKRLLLLVSSGLCFIVTLGLIRVNVIGGIYKDIILGFTTALFFTSIISMPNKKQLPWINSLATYFSKISYTLYLVHMPVAVFTTAWLVPTRMPWSVVNFCAFILFSAFIIIFSWGMWRIFERNTDIVKAYIMKNLYTLKTPSFSMMKPYQKFSSTLKSLNNK